ncbi:MAG TPA: hypothetical protein VIM97_14240 [Actinomycetes bacterium]
MSEQDRYTPEEWRTLQFAPFWMFSAVIGAYDRFDPRDFQVFSRCLETAALADGPLRREVLASVVADRELLADAYAADDRSIGVGLGHVATVLDKAALDEAELFKRVLIEEVGEGVARARGRFGSEMSKEDANALTLAAQLLSYDVEVQP